MRILFIATQLPPFNGSGNIRALNYINYLNRLGHKLDVVGVDYPKDSIAYDERLENVFDKEINIFRISPGYFYKFFYTKKTTIEATNIEFKNKATSKLNKYKQSINWIIKKNILIPDAFLFWINSAYKKARELNEINKYDCMITMHETPSSHLVGLKLKNKYPNLKWIAYWSDPWNEDSTFRKGSSIIKKYIEERLERKVIKNVDRYLFTTKKTLRLYSEKYMLMEKYVDIVYRGYDIDKYVELENSKETIDLFEESRINIVHTGTIYPNLRDINPLCDALNEIKKENENLFNKFNIVFIGLILSNDDKNKLMNLSNVKVIDPISYEEALRVMTKSDCLLLYGNKDSTQVPGKVYEYAGCKSKIITILGDEKDELKEIMTEINKGPIIENNKSEIKKALYNVEQENIHWKNRCDKYEWSNVAKDIEKKIRL